MMQWSSKSGSVRAEVGGTAKLAVVVALVVLTLALGLGVTLAEEGGLFRRDDLEGGPGLQHRGEG